MRFNRDKAAVIAMRLVSFILYSAGWILFVEGYSGIMATATILEQEDVRLAFHGGILFALGGVGMLRKIFFFGISFSHPLTWYSSTLRQRRPGMPPEEPME